MPSIIARRVLTISIPRSLGSYSTRPYPIISPIPTPSPPYPQPHPNPHPTPPDLLPHPCTHPCPSQMATLRPDFQEYSLRVGMRLLHHQVAACFRSVLGCMQEGRHRCRSLSAGMPGRPSRSAGKARSLVQLTLLVVGTKRLVEGTPSRPALGRSVRGPFRWKS